MTHYRRKIAIFECVEELCSSGAEDALRKICDALKAGYAVYDAQRQTEFISSESE